MKALNVKIALLTCVGFTVVMCWLVNQVSRPLATAAAAPAVSGSAPPSLGPGAQASTRGRAVDGLRRSSPIDASRVAGRAMHEAAAVRAATLTTERMEDRLPPVSAVRSVEATLAGLGPVGSDADRVGRGGVGNHSLSDFVASPEVASAVLVPEASLAGENTLTALRRSSTTGGTQTPGLDESTTTAATEAPAPAAARARYKVERGDTLSSIAKRIVGSDDARTLQALVAANPKLKSRPNKVLVGEVLAIPELGREPATPTRGVATKSSPGERGETVNRKASREKAARVAADSGPKTAAGKKSTAATASLRPSTAKAPRTTLVAARRNESLPDFAKRVLKDQKRWREIQALNGLKPGERLSSGQKLKVPIDSAT